MRFSTIIFSAVLAAFSVSAQTNGTATTSSALFSGTAITPAQASEAACLKSCAADDVSCRAACIPQGSTSNPINLCVGACVKGNGTAAENLAYQNCVQGCILTASYAPTAVVAQPTTASVPAGQTGVGASGTGGGAATGTGTGSSASASATKNASDNLRIGGSVAGVLAMFAAILAL